MGVYISSMGCDMQKTPAIVWKENIEEKGLLWEDHSVCDNGCLQFLIWTLFIAETTKKKSKTKDSVSQ